MSFVLPKWNSIHDKSLVEFYYVKLVNLKNDYLWVSSSEGTQYTKCNQKTLKQNISI